MALCASQRMLTTCDIPFDWSCVHVLLLTVSPSARSTDHEFDRAPDRSYDRSSHVHLFGYHKQPRHHAKVDHPWERLGWSIHLSLDFHAVLDFNLVGHGQKPVSFFQFGFTRPSDRYRGHPVTTLDQSNRTLTHVLIQLVSSNTCSQSAMKPMFTCSQCATSPPAACVCVCVCVWVYVCVCVCPSPCVRLLLHALHCCAMLRVIPTCLAGCSFPNGVGTLVPLYSCRPTFAKVLPSSIQASGQAFV